MDEDLIQAIFDQVQRTVDWHSLPEKMPITDPAVMDRLRQPTQASNNISWEDDFKKFHEIAAQLPDIEDIMPSKPAEPNCMVAFWRRLKELWK